LKEALTGWPHLSAAEGDRAYQFGAVSKWVVGRFCQWAGTLPRGPFLLLFSPFSFLVSYFFYNFSKIAPNELKPVSFFSSKIQSNIPK
jgi:hypothetical protein